MAACSNDAALGVKVEGVEVVLECDVPGSEPHAGRNESAGEMLVGVSAGGDVSVQAEVRLPRR